MAGGGGGVLGVVRAVLGSGGGDSHLTDRWINGRR
jgi:hypothetical protein